MKGDETRLFYRDTAPVCHASPLDINATTQLGKHTATKTDEFSEKYQAAFNPLLIFGKSCCGFRDKNG